MIHIAHATLRCFRPRQAQVIAPGLPKQQRGSCGRSRRIVIFQLPFLDAVFCIFSNFSIRCLLFAIPLYRIDTT